MRFAKIAGEQTYYDATKIADINAVSFNKSALVCPICDKHVTYRSSYTREDKIHVDACFIHFSSAENECTYSSGKDNESINHKIAKEMLKIILQNENINIVINLNCRCDQKKYSIDKKYNQVNLEHDITHDGNKYRCDVACIDIDSNINYVFEIYHTSKTKYGSRPERWFELNADEVINSFSNANIITLTCRRPVCKNCNVEYNAETEESPKIYYKQRGAGCGKTFESVRLPYKEYKDKSLFIYVTKTHAANSIINSEQIKLLIPEATSIPEVITIDNADEIIGGCRVNKIIKKEENKKYLAKVIVTDIETGEISEKSIVIGTVDSLIYSINNCIPDDIETENPGGRKLNVFGYFCDNIVSKNWLENVKYAGKSINKSTVIIIDESQDLEKYYLDALCVLINFTKASISVIGDRLQSIRTSENIMTVLHKAYYENKKYNDIPIENSEGVNVFRRNHNSSCINMINTLVNYHKYGLQPVQDICMYHKGGNCNREHIHNIEEECYNFISINDPTYNEEYVNNNIARDIINKMMNEVDKHCYVPNNFLIIFPIVKNNIFAEQLQEYIINAWAEKFQDKSYIKKLRKINLSHYNYNNVQYWINYIDSGKKGIKYAELHRSNEGESIKLDTSNNIVRMVSIHTSKGDGREVVFGIGMSDKKFNLFNGGKPGLIPDSLFHVTLTRHKHSLYYYVEHNSKLYHKINSKFDVYNFIEDDINISEYSSMDSFLNYIEELAESNPSSPEVLELVSYIDKEFKETKEMVNAKETSQTETIDLHHHLIRYYTIQMVILNWCSWDLNKKLLIIRNKKLKIISDWSEYFKLLGDLKEEQKKACKMYALTGNSSSYNKYNTTDIPLFVKHNNIGSEIVRECVQDVLEDMNLYGGERPSVNINNFCGLGLMVICYLVELFEKTKHSEFKHVTLRDIVISYLNYVEDTHKDKNYRHCRCIYYRNKYNIENIYTDSYTKAVVNHYNTVNKAEDVAIKLKHKYNFNRHYVEGEKTNTIKIPKSLFINTNNFKTVASYGIFGEIYIGTQLQQTIIPIIKPSFNKLNYYTTMIQIMIKAYFASKDTEERCIVTNNSFEIISLDYKEPIPIAMDISESNKIIEVMHLNYLHKKYKKKNAEVCDNFIEGKINRDEIEDLRIPTYMKNVILENTDSTCLLFELNKKLQTMLGINAAENSEDDDHDDI